MKEVYRTLNGYGEDQVLINKSTFIGYGKPIDSEKEALAFIEEISEKHRDATHNTYAYVLGEDSNIQRFSDDGEPSGTAGVPMLEVLKKEDLRNTVLVVTRYFGGIKLGAGGLIRAYTKGAKIAVDGAGIVNRTLHHEIKVRLDYTAYGAVENHIMNQAYIVDDTVYDEAVNIYLAIKYDHIDQFQSEITNLTSGDAEISNIGERYINLKV